MSQKTLGQIRQEVAEHLGILDVNGVDAFDNTTAPTLNRVNQFINDTLREVTSNFPYSIMERSCYLPFYHTIHNVPSAVLSGISTGPNVGVSGVVGTVTPFPNTMALQAGCITLPSNYNYSGIAFTGTAPVFGAQSGLSVSGYQTTGDWTGVGYMYELPASVDSIISVMLPDKGVKVNFVPMYDLNKVIPQGVWTSSGTTPIWYTEHVGMSASGNKVIEFFPSPDATLSGNSFMLYYKFKQQDMTDDSEVQNVYPDTFQDIAIHGVLEKCYSMVNDQDKTQYHRGVKEGRVLQLRKWAENQQDYVNRFRDGNGVNGVGAVGVDLAVGYMVNGFGG